jgi:hypothetical protein
MGMVAFKFTEEQDRKQQDILDGKKTDQHSLSVRGFSHRICNSLWTHCSSYQQQSDEVAQLNSQLQPQTPSEEWFHPRDC